MTFLELNSVQKVFGSTVAVRDVDLRVQRGEFISFLGPSGCGKTTTLRMVAGFEQPSSGTIMLDGVDISRLPASRRNVGMVFQSYALFPNMTVAQNIAFGLKLKRKSTTEINRRVAELLDLIRLPERGAAYPSQLSGGQQQRVALARALAIEPRVLLLDEPLSALDAKIRVALRMEIRAIQRQLGMTTIYVTHDQEEALSLSDRVVVMNNGRVEQVGTPFQIYNYPQTGFVATFVGTLNLLSATIVDTEAGIVLVERQELTLGRQLAGRHTGETVALALRPEVIAVADADAPLQLHGTVDEVSFLGGIVRVWLLLGARRVVFDLLNHPRLALPSLGQPLTVTFPGEACLVLDADPHSVPFAPFGTARMGAA